MDSLKDLAKTKKIPQKKDPKLHSAAHVLADELSVQLSDPKHFGFYLKMATTMPAAVLRGLAGKVLESPNVTNKGRLFAYLIKQYNAEQKAHTDKPTNPTTPKSS